PYPLALDVVGHELTHGVTQNSSDLVYELQPGALNEAFSDIFGVSVEASVVGQADWKMGEKLGKVFRDLKNPGSLQIEGLNKPYPSKMSEFIDLPNSDNTDHGGVHINSSIINHAYYLLAEGLNGAIGIGDAEKIFYRCLTQRLQRQSQFIDARLGCIASAEALFGADSTQARKTAEAFDAVEILATPPTPEPAPIPAVQGPDSTLAIGFDPFFGGSALGRRETAFNDPAGGVALVDSVKIARPAVSGDGTIAAFVDASFDVCLVRTDDPNSLRCLGMPGTVYSVALSPDANLIAAVLVDPATGQPDNRISVFDLAQSTTKTYDLLAPTIDGNPVDSVLHAESMVFTSDSKQLFYDAVSQIRLGGTAVQRWSVFRINLPTDTTTVLVPPIDGVNTGNPNIGRTGTRFLTFDAQDAVTFTTYIVNMDLFTGDFGGVGFVGQGVGFPCFNGDDTAVVFATQDINAFQTGFSLVKQQLSANRLTTNGLPTLWLSDANLGVIYRRGTFTSSNALPSVNLLAPSNNGVFTTPGPVAISASASDPDGTIAKVEFYQDADKIGESIGPQYSFLWTNVTAGSYRLFARALDNLGAANDSAPVSITVNPVGGASAKLSAARQTDGAIRLTVAGPVGTYTIEQSTDLAHWADIFPLTIGVSGSGTIDDKAGPQNDTHLFYRARRN
ncbi:MAG TPA: M4 family metallopeptidase, partial [Verrucomicrobiae bacterium]|nr:M4 family metallopeptidase [Verrucomicrobiae bacterium]